MAVQWKWEFQRNMDLLRIHAFATGWLCVHHVTGVSRQGRLDFYVDGEEMSRLSLSYLSKAKRSKAFARKLGEDAQRRCGALMRFADSLEGKDLQKLTDAALYRLYARYVRMHLAAAAFAPFIRIIIHEAVPYLEGILKRKTKDYEKALRVLTSTPEESFFGEEERMFYRLALSVAGNPFSEEALKKIRAHQERFSWIPCSYYDEEPYDLEHYLHRLRKVVEDPARARETLKKLEGMGSSIRKEQRRLLAALRLGREAENVVDCLQKAVYYKDFARGAVNHSYCLTMPLFGEIAKRLRMSRLAAKSLFPEELEQALLHGKRYAPVIRRRMDFYVLREKGVGLEAVTGRRAERIADAVEETLRPKSAEIRGICANGGYAKARVRVIFDPKEVQNEAHDFILVTSMTTPEFSVAMRKALAIVTDEGGITSHAAIVARELSKPCVIGTGNATKALSDGDIVEVDADMGVVRRIV